MGKNVIADNVKLEDLYNFLLESIGTITEYNVQIDTKITELGNYWQGNGYNALAKLYDSLKISLDAFVTDLSLYVDELKSVGTSAGVLYSVVKAALAVNGLVSVNFGAAPNLNSTGDDEYERVYGLRNGDYTDEKQALDDAKTVLDNLRLDIDILNAEYQDTYANMVALDKAFRDGLIHSDEYYSKMSELSKHLLYVNEQLGKYKEAAATMAMLTGNNTYLDLIGWFASDKSNYQDGKILEGADGFFHWGKDINLVNEGVGEAIDVLKTLDPVSTICHSAGVNGLGAATSVYMFDSFSEGSGVSQDSMSVAYSIAKNKGETTTDENGVVYFNSKDYHYSGKTLDYNQETNQLVQHKVPIEYLPEGQVVGTNSDGDVIYGTNYSDTYVNIDRVFTQERAYMDSTGSYEDTYTDPNTNIKYDSVMVNVDGETTYMTVPQYNSYLELTHQRENLDR